MISDSPRPEDFIVDYSPDLPARLVLNIVDERPGWGVKDIARRVRDLCRPLVGDVNDRRARQAWRAIETRWGTVNLATITTFLREHWSNDMLRKFEYAFQARCLRELGLENGSLVDMGGGYSYSTVVPALLRIPNLAILSVDVMHHRHASRLGIRYIRGDCMSTGLPDASADAVCLISTLEHVGLGRWGDPLDVHGDEKAMREAHRILKPDGHLILTVPYGYPMVVFNKHRIYDDGRLAKVCAGFTSIRAEYALLGQAVDKPTMLTRFQEEDRDLTGGVMLLLRKQN